MKKNLLISFVIILTIILIPVTASAVSLSGVSKKITNVDLDGDGHKDVIVVNFEDAYGNYATTCTIKINNSVYRIDGDAIETNIHIVDINKKDKYKEIAIVDDGPSDDYQTTFLYYNKKISRVGKISGALGYGLFCNGIVIKGSGVVIGESRGFLAQTWFYYDYYKLSSSHVLQRQPQKYYKSLRPNIITAKKTITLYSDNKKNIVARLKKGDKVTFIGSDEKQWCIVKMNNGKYGWFKSSVEAFELFDGLLFAD